jgi:hypothetical protein
LGESTADEQEVTDPREVVEAFLSLHPESPLHKRIALLDDEELNDLEKLAQQLFGQPAFA